MNLEPDQRSFSPRTYLFVPGDRPERFDTAWESPADAVIIDLEDSVPPDHKPRARQGVARWLSAAKPVWIRINAEDTPWFSDDLELLGQEGVAGVLVPKAEALPASVLDAAASRGLPVMPIVETAVGMRNVERLATTRGVARLAFGAVDFQVDMGIEGDDDALLFFRSTLVLASRLGALPAPVDGVTVAVSDAERLRHETLRARRLGFGAKLCIHPRQVEPVHDVMAPTKEERGWAARVIAGMEASRGAAVKVDGKMVDRPVLARAMRIAAAPRAAERLRR